MQFTVLKEHLERALRYSAKATARQSTLPIIQNVALIARDNTLYCMATNLDVGVIGRISGRIASEGGIVVPPQLLQSFIAAVDNGAQIEFVSAQDGIVVATSGQYHVEMKGYDVADFPIIPEKTTDLPSITFDAAIFAAAVNRVAPCVAKTEARPELTGVYVAHTGAVTRFVATDGFRLGESCIPATDGQGVDPVIIPSSAIGEVLQVIADGGCESIVMSYGDGQVFFGCGDVMVVSRVIAGNYPDYQQIIPKSQTARVVAERAACEKAIRLADAFAVRSTSDMFLRVQPDMGTIIVGSASHDRGKNHTTLTVDVEGDAQEIFLNTRYVLDGIGQCGTDRVMMRFGGAAAPVVIEPEKNGTEKGFLYLVMPIRR